MTTGAPDRTGRRRLGEAALVAVSFFAYAVVAAPVPALNEPHYLTKARHFWRPDWCAGDLFLASADAHVVFFATVGALTNWSLDAAAWGGRLLQTAVLAWGWTRLCRVLVPAPGSALAAAWFFLGLTTCGNLSGEWIVGGVEAKVFTYGLLFAACADLFERRWLRGAAWLGLAIAFHPVVGLWGALALGCGAAGTRVLARWFPLSQTTAAPAVKVGTLCAAAGLTALLAAPGLIPVLRLVLEPVDATTRYAGTYLQVYYRLAHHLDPMQFSVWAYLGYAVLAAVWLCGAARGPAMREWRWWHALVAASLLFAVGGFLAGWGPRPPQEMPYFATRMHLLKFYPFRLVDALLPITVALLAAGWLVPASPPDAARRGRLLRWAGLAAVYIAALWWSHRQLGDQRYDPARSAEWRDVCAWMREHAPPDALVQTPHYAWTFKWFAERPEYATYKDCPQDVRGIVEWNRRLRFLTRWYSDHYADERYTRDEMADLRRQTGVTHLVTDKLGPIELPPVYRNARYRVYDLTQVDEPASPALE